MQPTVVKKASKTAIENAAELKAEIDQTPNATDEKGGSKKRKSMRQ